MFTIKILLGGLNHEINSFSPGRTGIAEYKRKQFWFGEEMLEKAAAFVRCGDDVDGLAACYHELNDAGAENPTWIFMRPTRTCNRAICA